MMSAASECVSSKYCGALCAVLFAGFLHLSPVWAGDDDVASGSAAAAIREAGYPCAHVIAMERSGKGDKAGSSIWTVRSGQVASER